MLRLKGSELKEKCNNSFKLRKHKNNDNSNNKEDRPKRLKDWLKNRNVRLDNKNKKNKSK